MMAERRIIACVLMFFVNLTLSIAGSERIKLTDLKTITLYNGRMTNSRRTSPVPQLKCLGGTAGCSTFIPNVVQCSNRGSDGYDVQWECKTDMDNEYRFGSIEVICEGYDYPDDPYILRGSCGLEYTIDLTKGGYQQKNSNSYGYKSQNYGYNSKTEKTSILGDILVLVIIVIIIYAIARTCLYRNEYSTTSDDQPFPPSNDQNFSGGFFAPGFSNPRSAPPPPGFRTDYNSDYGAGCGTSSYPRSSSTGGGFWTGAMTGGLLGYMFGSRSNTGGGSYHSPRSSYFHGSSSSSSYPSSETRTASGFGGTRRR